MAETVRSVLPERPVADDKPQKVYTVTIKPKGNPTLVYHTDFLPTLLASGAALRISDAVKEYREYYKSPYRAVMRYGEEVEVFYVVANLVYWSVRDNQSST